MAGLYPAFVFASGTQGTISSVSVASLRAQIQEVESKAFLLREKVKMFAFRQPLQAAPSSARWQVALQVGHWKMEEVPWELRGLNHSEQARGGGKMEWEINLAIAQKAAELLGAHRIGVTLLGAALPGIYKADALVAIHADQNPNLPRASGFKVAASAHDKSGKARRLAQLLEQEYRRATGLDREVYIPESMSSYYAFNSDKFLYAVHPLTPSVIIETGYLPNPRDRAIILTNPQMAAAGIVQALVKFLEEHGTK